MAKEILIKTHTSETQIAITERGRLVEFYIENPTRKRTLGNIYLGSIQSVRRNLEAAFVDIGEGKTGFLHRTSLSSNLAQQLAFLKKGGLSVEKFRENWTPKKSGPGKTSGTGHRRKPRGRHGGGCKQAQVHCRRATARRRTERETPHDGDHL